MIKKIMKMAKIYKSKNAMIDAVPVIDRESKMFLQYPVNSNGCCNFTVIDKDKDFFSNIKSTKSNSKFLQEMFIDGTKRKPYLDIEHYYPSEKEFKKDFKRIIPQIVNDIIQVFAKEYDQVIKLSDVLLLNSSGQSSDGYKLSVHVVVSPKNKTFYYTNSKKIENNTAYHLYASLININSEYKDKENFNDKPHGYLDEQVYRKDATLRMIGSCKYPTGDRCLDPIDSKTLEKLDLTDKQKLNYLISYIDDTKPTILLETPIIQQTTISKTKIQHNEPTKTNINNKLLDLVKKYHPSAKQYGSSKEGYYNFNYDNRTEKCPLSGVTHDSNGFYVIEKSSGCFLKCYSKKCHGKSMHLGYVDETDQFVDEAHQINTKYLLQDPLVPKLLEDWINKGKTFAIKSAMGTGKTYLIKHILDKYKLNKVLWITHRQTLTKSLYGSFKDYGFVSYMDTQNCLYQYDKVLVQIDSLMRIKEFDMFENKQLVKKYDLVIIDEIEGCLSHYESPYLNKPDIDSRYIFNFMIDVIRFSNKLIVLDADISIRTQLFIEHIDKITNKGGNYIMINNSYQPITKTFTITNDEGDFDTKLFADIKAKKNICVVSMSAGAVNKIAVELNKMGTKYVSHTSKSNDSLKKNLEDVNNFWKQQQVVMFSPSIISGIDFNEIHFDKMYCIIKSGNKTCDPRSFLQMVGRIRHLGDQNIFCWYQQIPIFIDKTNKIIPKLQSDVYTFDDLLSYYRYYETLRNKKIIKNVVYETVEGDDVISFVNKSVEIDLFDKISLHNEVEQLNKHQDVFLTVLNRLIMRAGNKIDFKLVLKDDKKPIMDKINNREEEINIMIDLDDSKYDIKELSTKQTNNQLTEIEKLFIKKYYFKKKLGIKKEIDKDKLRELMTKYMDKEYFIERYEILFGYKKISDSNDDSKTKEKDRIKRKIIVDFVNILIGKHYNNCLNDSKLKRIIIKDDQYSKALKKIIKESMYFSNEEKYRPLFRKKKGSLKSNPKKEKEIQFYTSTLVRLLREYNIILKVESRKKTNGKSSYLRSLSVDKQIKDVVENKYNHQ
ncbi:helicase origin binding protein [Acanthamoeba castellanii mimivirus]|uniref:Uncharacterized putative helicase R8 n=5 Tax=Mimivirus TaxID=315393 RepID=YR008_MIMIV|nr:RecName: Full=Uncharacterized putative helicase R8 [Acanthamoeba polyphaga mimivirus]AHJ39843.2 helicase origin binding protein [Samba virus]ALR83548.1 helicase [Niemeyer virus]BAV61076.1 helicase origin binding protein [Acanthamoeba castellanii mimivirus]AAV50283.1 helicase similar to origin binding protein [Acanthamoeba polyphaga mimivirus]BAV62064.1 helicase similar to origin binding protein [Acanthamoeba castellanii mimivirus]